MNPPDIQSYRTLIELAKQEDLGPADLTGQVTIPPEQRGRGRLRAREPAVLCGLPVIEEVLRVYDADLICRPLAADGDEVAAQSDLAELSGPLRSLLAAERVVLNFLQRLSGIATRTARFVQAVEGTRALIYDTRKTTPSWRALERYAVRCGGGENHRQGLFDAVLIKDNHLAALATQAAGSLTAALGEVIERIGRLPTPPAFVQVEVDDLDQLRQVLAVKGVDLVLLDNMSCNQMAQAVQIRDRQVPPSTILLEASGNIRLETVREVALTGVERISVGALTHSVASVDIGLDLESD
ncbi:MAG: carboxylating nicotinate-nucleotide diphosphorylase [Sedimentisphaerales bacterium]|nr:carboxylating nicotinate-nucleotide diphosphorylase [Sedimentisphaerales bacterium]